MEKSTGFFTLITDKNRLENIIRKIKVIEEERKQILIYSLGFISALACLRFTPKNGKNAAK